MKLLIPAMAVLALLVAPAAARGQAVAPAAASTPRLIAGGVLGGALGAAAGALAGVYIGGNRCSDPGNPDSCDGLAGLAIGFYAGHTIGAPVGVHVANRGRDRLSTAVLVSTGIAAAGVAAIAVGRAAAPPDHSVHPAVGPIVLVGVPVAQLAGSVLLARRARR